MIGIRTTSIENVAPAKVATPWADEADVESDKHRSVHHYDWRKRLAENLGPIIALLPAEAPLSLTEFPAAPPDAQDVAWN